LAGAVIDVVTAGRSRLWITEIILIFVPNSGVSVGMILLLFIRAKSFHGLCDHGFNRRFRESGVDGRGNGDVGSSGKDCFWLALLKTHLISFHFRTVSFPGVGMLGARCGGERRELHRSIRLLFSKLRRGEIFVVQISLTVFHL
jgi:hypothetical protein